MSVGDSHSSLHYCRVLGGAGGYFGRFLFSICFRNCEICLPVFMILIPYERTCIIVESFNCYTASFSFSAKLDFL